MNFFELRSRLSTLFRNDRFRVRLRHVPPDLFDEATRIVASYSVALVRDDRLIGSGTLVEIDGRRGILTAHHVASLINFRDATGSLGICIADFAHNFQIKSSFLTHYPIGIPKCEAYGPDLSFIEIPVSPELSEISAKKSFYSLTVRSVEKVKGAASNFGFWLAAGCPDELVHGDEPTNDFSHVIAMPGIGACTGIERRRRKSGFDYFDVGVDYGGESESVNNFGGMSGGGVWRFDLIQGNEANSPIRLGKPYLCGVVLWQSGIKRRHRVLRAHGHNSIYRLTVKLREVTPANFLAILQSWLRRIGIWNGRERGRL